MNIKSFLSLSTVLAACLLVLTDCKETPYQQGKILYENFCASCHMDDGGGLTGNIPPLANADYVKQEQAQIACIIRYGQMGEVVVNGVTYNNPMPAVPQLSDFEITNVLNYINTSWGNDYGVVKLSEVRAALQACQ
ncbi:MAG: cytochrome c [Bacteroidota bacterium]